MKKVISFLAATLCAFSPLLSQYPFIEWQNTIGGDDIDVLNCLQQTFDGGYILGGYSKSNISDDKTENSIGIGDYWVVKLDPNGDVEWQNTIGGGSNDELTSLQQTIDGGYILGGYSNSYISGDKTEHSVGYDDYWVVKLNSIGDIQWQNTIGGNSYEYFTSIQQTSDKGFILGGTSLSDISGDKTENNWGSIDFWVVKLDTSGAIQWQNTIGGESDDRLHSLQQTTDGGYIIGGSSSSNNWGDKTENRIGQFDYWVVKLDAAGAIQWQNTIGGSFNDQLYSIQQTADGGYILGGDSNSNISGDKTENSLGSHDFWVVKLDTDGVIQWQNTIGGSSDDFLHSLQQTVDGGYILGGSSSSDISGDKNQNSRGGLDYWVVKIDNLGVIQWQLTIGGSSGDGLNSICQTNDNGYILGGISHSYFSFDKIESNLGNGDYWVVKLSPTHLHAGEALPPLTGITLFPNPATDALFVYSEATSTLCLRNIFGLVLSTHTIQGESEIDLSRYPNGIYFLIEMETGIGHRILKTK
ncbi:MAG TPA: T9SS C-terminal target domain-containing protein [Saprospirales bacterium]|nr:T9SS C-terminal target domain-containing protein [Saprospirales bacterium]